jgi:elongation factor 2
VKSHLPVRNSFGLINDLRSKTSGKAFTQCNFDHWDIINEDPLDEENKIRQLIVDLRKKKKLNEVDIPPLNRFLDIL